MGVSPAHKQIVMTKKVASMTTNPWGRTGTAPQRGLPFGRTLEPEAELGQERTSTFAFQSAEDSARTPYDPSQGWAPLHASTRAPRVPLVAAVSTFFGELLHADPALTPAQLQAIETLAALCALIGQSLPEDQSVEVELRQGKALACAIALDRDLIMIDFIEHSAARQDLEARARKTRDLYPSTGA